jgi:hypothetical protein
MFLRNKLPGPQSLELLNVQLFRRRGRERGRRERNRRREGNGE